MFNFKTKNEILWDYKKPIDDLLWKLQRIILFFPSIGTDRETIDLLYANRDKLKLEYMKSYGMLKPRGNLKKIKY